MQWLNTTKSTRRSTKNFQKNNVQNNKTKNQGGPNHDECRICNYRKIRSYKSKNSNNQNHKTIIKRKTKEDLTMMNAGYAIIEKYEATKAKIQTTKTIRR